MIVATISTSVPKLVLVSKKCTNIVLSHWTNISGYSQKEFVDNVVIQVPWSSSEYNQLHFNIKIKSDKTKVKQCRRDFRKGNYKEIRKRLAHIDGNDIMKIKTAT